MKEIPLTQNKFVLVDDELDAAATYDLMALKLFGEFANTNFEMSLVA